MYKWIVLMFTLLLSSQVQAGDQNLESDTVLNATQTAAAQIQRANGNENKKQMSELVKELNLTHEQREKAKQISDATRFKMEQLQNSMNLILQQARELEEQSLSEFAEILNDDQKAKFHEFKALRNDELKAHDDIIDDIMAPFNE